MIENKTLTIPGEIVPHKVDIGPTCQISRWQYYGMRGILDLEIIPVFCLTSSIFALEIEIRTLVWLMTKINRVLYVKHLVQ